jgi:hypothetical protein
MRSLAAAIISAAALFSLSARAEVVRFPETGFPAFVITTPDGWTHQPDGDGNMLLIAGSKTASYALTVGSYSGSLDDRANAPQSMGPAKISGYRGYTYDSDMVNSSGVRVNVHMVAVKIGTNDMASITMLSVEGIAGDDYQAAQSVLRNTSLVAK